MYVAHNDTPFPIPLKQAPFRIILTPLNLCTSPSHPLPHLAVAVRRRRGNGATGKVAVVGMAGRFPGADSVASFWENLRAGRDTARRLTPDELSACGVPQQLLDHASFVPVAYALEGPDRFDAPFFGIGAKEATIMDPQHRVFLQTAWEAFEAAGMAPRSGTPLRTGVFAASGIDGYMIHHLNGEPLKQPMDPGTVFMGEIGSEKDYIATRVSFQLDLMGPSMNVNSACSSGLVATAQAVHALLLGQCDVALAGGASITFPNTGILHEEGMVNSADGRVCPFDRAASGTVFGDAVGAVVLKRLEDAEEDGDFIWGVISGACVNNDGHQKAGYAAPSSRAQAEVIRSAQEMAGVRPRDISYIECHATATLIGDSIEVQGLKRAFAAGAAADEFVADGGVQAAAAVGGQQQQQPATCALGSVKGNIGHANCAAGITGLIKTLLCLKHQMLVPTVHFKEENPKLKLDGSPFFIHMGLSPWELSPPQNRRIAGVSSFGIGGTNCHLCVEEWVPPANDGGRPHLDAPATEILAMSAKSAAALKRNVARMVDYAEVQTLTAARGGVLNCPNVASLANTLQTGREQFPYRAAVTVPSTSLEGIAKPLRELQQTLAQQEEGEIQEGTASRVVFVFPGQGSQYITMGQQLYQTYTIFRAEFDTCANYLVPLLGFDIRSYVFPLHNNYDAGLAFNRPKVIQPSIFAVEYSLARTLMACGITPIAVAGHSIGEYTAAAIAGVISVEVALELVALRASLTETDCPEGGMLSVTMSAAEAATFAAEQLAQLGMHPISTVTLMV